jgi:acrylyl-CoA reductase (NADPH)
MESARWAAVVDSVGGNMLARVLGQIQYAGSAAAIGNAGGVIVPASVIPFLLRGINLLGIDSVMQPNARRQMVWEELAKTLDFDVLQSIITVIGLGDLPAYGENILKGQISGRVVVDLSL